MSEDKVDFVTYTNKHSCIVKGGIEAINKVLNGTGEAEKRSLLFCLDKYLDPYYGYNLPYFDDIIMLLQDHLFLTNIKEVKEDILQLLGDYATKSLDYLATRIDELESEPELLEYALYALGNTCNHKYIPIFIRYENHHNPIIRSAIKDILIDLSNKINKW
ncbi:hypothetical protein [Clostridium sp. HMP27]|uniref:hypothetical protein n=1 Tax=Clostridium sp. HMP27 TaxID=1487921 RepID=UPI00068F3696|nr:hypothetical protein [Clostridium sp. HMP27]